MSEEFFEVAGLEIGDGRGFVTSDFRGEPMVAVVNHAFARKHWPGESPFGRRFQTYNDFYPDVQRRTGPAAPEPEHQTKGRTRQRRPGRNRPQEGKPQGPERKGNRGYP